MGLKFNAHHVNWNSGENYQNELIYMGNYPPVIILLLSIYSITSHIKLKILCIKVFFLAKYNEFLEWAGGSGGGDV